MVKKFLLVLQLICIAPLIKAQYLLPVFQNQVVSLQVVSSGLFADANFGGGSNAIVNTMQPLYEDQQFLLVSTSQANWYRIRDQRTLKFITLHSPVSNQPVYLEASGYGGDARLQEFQFVAQTEPGRYKIHTRFQEGGLDLLLEVDPASTGITGLRLGKNVTAGNALHQKFDAARIYPDVSPSSAIPTLADRFQGRTCGLTMKHNGFQLQKSAAKDLVYQAVPYTDFEKQFKIEYTGETGWYKIKHKTSGKYLTLQLAAANVNLNLSTDAGTDDNLQKFKFIVQANDSTYKIHTKYSYGVGVNEVALVLEMPPSISDTLRCAANNTSAAAGADWNQQFIIRKYLPPAAEFVGGVPSGSAKINGKQYYLSLKESMALLQPVIEGSDTVVKFQTSVVYGETAEWTFDLGDKLNGIQYLKIRYGKTNQYLYAPSATQSTIPAAGTKFILKTKTDTASDKRYEFRFDEDGSTNNWFQLWSKASPSQETQRKLMINDDGILILDDNLTTTFDGNRKFAVNLSIPLDGSKLYNIITKNQGHFVSDSGMRINNTPAVHIKYADYSCYWHFVPATGGRFYIQNTLTKLYLTNNGSSALGAAMSMTNNQAAAGTLWELSRAGNFYNIKNATGGRYLGLLNHPDDGAPLYQGLSSDAGTDWIITRGDYYQDPLPVITLSQGLLTNYAPFALNALNSSDYRDKLIRNIGLPYEPAVQTILYGIGASSVSSNMTGISQTADFLSVVKSALQFQFALSADGADSALRNYKLDTAGMRTDVAFALKNYITDNLALRSRTTWNENEKQLVEYLERRIKSMRANFGDRIDSAWKQFQILTGSSTTLAFSALLAGPPSTDFKLPEYYNAEDGKALTLLEYTSVSKTRNYKNPKFLGLVLSLPAVSSSAVAGTLSAVIPAVIMTNKLVDASVFAAETVTFASKFPSTLAAYGTVGFGTAAVVLVAAEILAEQAIEVAEFVNFDNDVKRKVARLRNSSIDVSIMNTNLELQKLDLLKDFDLILGAGERFDVTDTRKYIFNGSGFWSNANNWLNGEIPLANVNNVEITISPKAGGQCNIDVPVTIPQNSRLKISSGASIRVNNVLKVPALILNQQ